MLYKCLKNTELNFKKIWCVFTERLVHLEILNRLWMVLQNIQECDSLTIPVKLIDTRLVHLKRQNEMV